MVFNKLLTVYINIYMVTLRKHLFDGHIQLAVGVSHNAALFENLQRETY